MISLSTFCLVRPKKGSELKCFCLSTNIHSCPDSRNPEEITILVAGPCDQLIEIESEPFKSTSEALTAYIYVPQDTQTFGGQTVT
jgi:hypothetical protein